MIKEMDANAISSQLRQRRNELGLSLTKVARRAGTSPASLSRYESGWHRFELYTLHKLAAALDCRLVIGLEPLKSQSPRQGREAAVRQLRRLFWDKPLASADLRDHPTWVARRVLEYGGLSDVQALVGLVGKEELLRLVAGLRFSSEKTDRFWAAMLEQEGVKCRRKSSPRAAGISWLR
jgi:transcriptional regulator with XRE-family HTH domain